MPSVSNMFHACLQEQGHRCCLRGATILWIYSDWLATCYIQPIKLGEKWRENTETPNSLIFFAHAVLGTERSRADTKNMCIHKFVVKLCSADRTSALKAPNPTTAPRKASPSVCRGSFDHVACGINHLARRNRRSAAPRLVKCTRSVGYCIALEACERTLPAFEPISRIVKRRKY
jgi:hypothetical protein